MARTLTLRLNEAQYEALRSKAADLNLTPTQVILDALESYGALPPDEGFNLKLRAHLRDIFGFSSPEGLEAFVLGLFPVQKDSPNPSPLDQYILLSEEKRHIANDSEKPLNEVDSSILTPPVRAPNEAVTYILSELQYGRDVAVSDIAKRFGLSYQAVSKAVGVKAKRKRSKRTGMERAYFYTPDMYDHIKNIIRRD